MKAFAALSTAEKSPTRHRCAKSMLARKPKSYSASDNSEMHLQRKATCPCGGGCPGCISKSQAESSSAEHFDAPGIVREVLISPGQPLDLDTRTTMESRFGYDFGHVRVHTDAMASESSTAVGALAYTVGRDMVFESGQYAPHTLAGQRLLAHELAHVVQQSDGPGSKAALRLNRAEDEYEHEADRAAETVIAAEGKDTPRIANNVAQGLSRKAPSLQRTAKWAKGTIDPSVNPAEQISDLSIADKDLYLGRTDFVLNGKSLTGLTVDKMVEALDKPSLDSSKRASTGIDCWFSSVPNNVATYDMKTLTKGSWSYVTDKEKLAKRFPSLTACKKGTGQVTFVVKGEPKVDDVRTDNETHEKKHAKDYEAIFNAVLVPWDKAVTKAHKDNSKVPATDIKVCERVLYNAHVGEKQRPEDVMTKVKDEIKTKADDFHGKPAGRKPNTKIESVDSDCNLVKVRTGY